MTKLYKFLAQVAAGAAVFAAASAQSQILYENISNFVANFNIGNGEIGNQISLPGNFGSYMITKFIFQFDFTGTTPAPNGTEMADMRFYLNDGSPVPPTSNTAPGTIIYDSGQFSIEGFTDASKAIFGKADLSNGVVVPQNFTWTVKFSGLTPNESAGLGICETTTIGTNFNAVWLESFEGWEFLTTTNGTPAPNFGAVAYGTPLPQLQSASQDGMLLLSWPTNFTGFTVQTTTNLLNPTNWVPVTNVVVVNGQNVLSNAVSCDAAFFRLVNTSIPAY